MNTAEPQADQFVSLTPDLIKKLELLLAVVYNDYESYRIDPDFMNEIIEAHESWAWVCAEAGGEVDFIE